ncbi:MAG TPA: ferritin family protein [Acidisoma sp.]|jgi:rubrerythrin|uniref:iron exporter MbfA n=1 Tax=Acidisoma sp. TaxID=1872115 RepID=UPI002CDF951A|nr:ferritin family protein [Acidisoma sp.]HTI01819.1 ferritin family protein [Acidisoma sp.]
MRNFSDLNEREILALAIGNEEEDGRIYLDLADGLRDDYPATAGILNEMAEEENEHRRELLSLYQEKFGDHIPLIRRQDIRGFLTRKPIWQLRPLRVEAARALMQSMELETESFYNRAASRSQDASIRKLLGDLAMAEKGHEHKLDRLIDARITDEERGAEADAARRNLVLRYIQPGLAGLMDGSVSTLAPLFASAFATGSSWQAFIVGISASLGAGISMAFAEALSDNGSLTGRGSPIIRGLVCGVMTTLGGLGHSLPFLIPNFHLALAIAVGVVIVELAVISWVRWKYMDTPPVAATLQVAFGGALVFATGVLIGSS